MKKNIPLANLKKQYHIVEQDIKEAIYNVLESGNYIMGKNVIKLEKRFAKYIGVTSAVSCDSGSSALVMALRACGVGEGDEVITSAMSFFATAEAIVSTGAKPVFVDIDPDSYTINPGEITSKITSKTKVIIPVHMYGRSADMDKIMKIAKKHKLLVIEDACQSIGAKFKGRMTGSIGDAGCFSFFPTKNLGAYGDGGIVTTNNDKIACALRALRSHGSGVDGLNFLLQEKVKCYYEKSEVGKYHNFLIGYNSRLDEIQAAVLLVKLKKMNKWNKVRIKNAKFYNLSLKNTTMKLPKLDDLDRSVFHHYIVLSEKRDELKKYLERKGISSGIYYPVPLHLQPALISLGYKRGDMPFAEKLALQNLAIPIYPELTNDEKRYIVRNIIDFTKND